MLMPGCPPGPIRDCSGDAEAAEEDGPEAAPVPLHHPLHGGLRGGGEQRHGICVLVNR